MKFIIAHLFEAVTYMVFLSICIPHAYTAINLDNLQLAYANTATTLLVAIMLIRSVTDLIRSLFTKRKGRRYK